MKSELVRAGKRVFMEQSEGRVRKRATSKCAEQWPWMVRGAGFSRGFYEVKLQREVTRLTRVENLCREGGNN